MKLSALNENMEQTQKVLKDIYPDIPTEVLTNVISKSPDELCAQWVIKQIDDKEIRWPEDAIRLVAAYQYYLVNKGNNKYQESLRDMGINQPKNILTYGLRDIEALDNTSNVDDDTESQRAENRRIKRNGSTLIYDGPKGKVIKITKSDAMVLYAKNTKWCVSNEEVAGDYLDERPIYMLIVDGRKYLVHAGEEERQLMDDMDRPVKDVKIDELILSSGPVPDLITVLSRPYSDLRPTNDPYVNYTYALEVLRDRWPEAEEIILQDTKIARWYAELVMKGRWPDLEKLSLQSPADTYRYARDIIEGRWPEGEEVIIQYPKWAIVYARQIIGGRWPEAEESIKRDVNAWNEYVHSILLKKRVNKMSQEWDL